MAYIRAETMALGMFVLSLGCAVPDNAAPSDHVETSFTSMLDGVSLSGWNQARAGGATFKAAPGRVIHVYPGIEDGATVRSDHLFTDTEYSNFTFRVEYRWLGPRYVPRGDSDRDAGILFHIASDVESVWPPCIEMQIGDSPLAAPDGNSKWMTGDLWVLGEPVSASSPSADGRFEEGAVPIRFGEGEKYGTNRVSEHAERPLGEWNELELTVRGADEAIFRLNGITLNRVSDMRVNDAPLASGRIGLQAEFAELQYRNPRIKELRDKTN